MSLVSGPLGEVLLVDLGRLLEAAQLLQRGALVAQERRDRVELEGLGPGRARCLEAARLEVLVGALVGLRGTRDVAGSVRRPGDHLRDGGIAGHRLQAEHGGVRREGGRRRVRGPRPRRPGPGDLALHGAGHRPTLTGAAGLAPDLAHLAHRGRAVGDARVERAQAELEAPRLLLVELGDQRVEAPALLVDQDDVAGRDALGRRARARAAAAAAGVSRSGSVAPCGR